MGRDRGDERPRQESVREAEGEEVGRALIDVGPEESAGEGGDRERGVRQVERAEDEGHDQHALPPAPPDRLRAAVDEALQGVLLEQPPEDAERGRAEDGLPAAPAQEFELAREPAPQQQQRGRR